MTWTSAAPGTGPSTDPATDPAVDSDPAPPAPEQARSRPWSAAAARLRRLPRPTRPRRPTLAALSSLPVTERTAAALTGGVAVLVGVVLLWVSLQVCTVVRGVSSCGSVGLLAILAVLVVQVLLGGLLLATWRVTEPRSTSLLGLGLVSSVAMVLLYASVPVTWLSLALLLVGPAAYVVAQGVTSSRFTLPERDPTAPH